LAGTKTTRQAHGLKWSCVESVNLGTPIERAIADKSRIAISHAFGFEFQRFRFA
jgi:hypothetical protein